MTMLGNVVTVDFFEEDVLGVVISEQEFEYKNQYCIIARSKLVATDENVQKLNQMSFDEILDFDTSSQIEKDLKIIGKHESALDFVNKVNKYQSIYRPLRTVELVEAARNFPKDADAIHRHAFKNVANEKDVSGIVYELLNQ